MKIYDNGSIKKKIGTNRINGWKIAGFDSSFNGQFGDDDIVGIEADIADNRYCTIGDVREAYEILKNILINNKPETIYEQAECVEEAVLAYFGDYSNTNERLDYFPDEEEVADGKKEGRVSDLAHKNAAMCVERSMLAQNLLKTLGIDTTYKMSGIFINGKNDSHAYNLISHDGKYYLFDVTIPTLKDDKICPIICEIPKDVYDKISNPASHIGESIHVCHYNPLQKKDYDIVYDAGRKELYETEKTISK